MKNTSTTFSVSSQICCRYQRYTKQTKLDLTVEKEKFYLNIMLLLLTRKYISPSPLLQSNHLKDCGRVHLRVNIWSPKYGRRGSVSHLDVLFAMLICREWQTRLHKGEFQALE